MKKISIFLLIISFSCATKGMRKNISDVRTEYAEIKEEVKSLQEENDHLKGLIEKIEVVSNEKIILLEEKVKELEIKIEDQIKEKEKEKEKIEIKKVEEKKEVENIKKQSVDEIYKKARSFHESKDYEKAEILYISLKGTPSKWYEERAYYFLGSLYYESGGYEKAIYILDEFIQKYPKSLNVPGAIYIQGDSLFKLGKKKESYEFFKELVLYYPNSKEAKEAKKRLQNV